MNTICGVDVSKLWLDAHVEPQQASGRFANTAEGIRLPWHLLPRGRRGTGGDGSHRRLGAPGISFVVAGRPGLRARQPAPGALFRRGDGADGKTDRIDAGVMARFARPKGLAASPPPSPAAQRLCALVARLGQVTGDLVINKQRRHAAFDADTLGSLNASIALLKRTGALHGR